MAAELENSPMITAFADRPEVMMAFCHRWSITNPLTRPCVVTCSKCHGALPMALISDVAISEQDTSALVTLELAGRGWVVTKRGEPICPACR
jgi:hypothetical protein